MLLCNNSWVVENRAFFIRLARDGVPAFIRIQNQSAIVNLSFVPVLLYMRSPRLFGTQSTLFNLAQRLYGLDRNPQSIIYNSTHKPQQSSLTFHFAPRSMQKWQRPTFCRICSEMNTETKMEEEVVKEEENNNDNNNNDGAKKHSAPDFGTSYVPNAGPEQYAPKSLDHFKRGYEERAAQRDKEFYTLRNGPTGRGRSGGGGRYDNNNNNGHHNSNNGREDQGGLFRDRPTILQGLDINALVDRLSTKLSNKEALFQDLDQTRQENKSVFESGKAMTALISVAARRKNIGLGHAVWDWMDHAKIMKNTFHYNSMISVTEKARDYQRALALLKEMKERKISKNEVT